MPFHILFCQPGTAKLALGTSNRDLNVETFFSFTKKQHTCKHTKQANKNTFNKEEGKDSFIHFSNSPLLFFAPCLHTN